ncbi:hypothetical protein ACN27G_23755 [Plantactinospora sp. WMMB334]|uniref:hypothetical protein n=1 Tax=Plantactinospora sp. WMMB334 TaxID=3404119 RepID=UPI003B94A65E
MTYLEVALAATVPTDPHQPIPVPQTPRPHPVDDPARLTARLGERHPGRPVTVRFDRTGCTIHLHEDGSSRLLAGAATLRQAVAALGLPSPDPPR